MATIAANQITLNTLLADGSKVYDIDTSVWEDGKLVIATVLDGRCSAKVVDPTDLIEIA